jgi:hypothetical protein
LSTPPLARITVGVVVERRAATSAWIDHVWRPVNVLAAEVNLYRSETTNYRDNLASGDPALWVVLRPTGADPPFEIVTVTADPAEGEAFTETGTDLVETVPMPAAVAETVAAFVAEHHVERTFHKRQRDRADPEALGRRRRTDEDDG